MKMIKHFSSIFILAVCTAVHAAPHIGFLMPSGGQRGTTVNIIIGGQAFGGVREAWVSGSGITVEKVQYISGLANVSGSQRNYINKVLRNYHTGKPDIPPPEDQEGWRKHDFYNRLFSLSDCERDILYRALLVPRNSLQASPAISGRMIVRLNIAADAEVGMREFRLVARDGTMSNPLKFVVGSAPECREGFFPYPPAKQIMPEIAVPSAVNGQITPGETDRYNFKAVKDQVITFKLLGRFFNPFIGDGVPGHFQPVLEVVDAKGKVLAYADDYYFDPDPVLTFKAPSDGMYKLHVRDAIYRGREDFVYRIEVMEGSYPLPDAAAPEIGELKVKDFSKTPAAGAVLQYPLIVKDVLRDKAGNTYTLENLKKDEEIVLEIFARRLELPPDTVVKVFDSKGKLVTFNDDVDRFKAGTILHNTADSMIYFKVPADGNYTISVSDTACAYGEAYKYFLRIDRKRVRFAVYSVPSSLRVMSGTANTFKLTVDRFEQYQGPIKIKVRSPQGFRIIGSDTIPANCNSTTLTLEAPQDKSRQIKNLVLEASAWDFSTTVIPGNEATQAFAYTHIIPAEYFPVRVTGASRGMFWKGNPQAVTLSSNKNATLKITHNNIWMPADIHLEVQAVELPDWVKIMPNPRSKVKTVRRQDKRRKSYVAVPEMELSLQCTAAGTGKSANALFKVVWVETSRPDKNGKVRKSNREIMLPAIRLEGGKN